MPRNTEPPYIGERKPKGRTGPRKAVPKQTLINRMQNSDIKRPTKPKTTTPPSSKGPGGSRKPVSPSVGPKAMPTGPSGGITVMPYKPKAGKPKIITGPYKPKAGKPKIITGPYKPKAGKPSIKTMPLMKPKKKVTKKVY